MSEYEKIGEIPTNDLFLKSIRDKIGTLGIYSVIAILILGFFCLITLWRSNSNNIILNDISHINELRHEITDIENRSYKNVNDMNTILNNLDSMMEYAKDASSRVYAPKTSNDIKSLIKGIEKCSKNFTLIKSITAERGFSYTKGAYGKYNDIQLPSEDDKLTDNDIKRISALFFELDSRLNGYTSKVVYGEAKPSDQWELRSLYSKIMRISDKASSSYQKTISKKHSHMNRLMDLDTTLFSLRKNHIEQFDTIKELSERIRLSEESNTSIEKTSLITLMMILIIISIILMIGYALALRKNVTDSISVFNELMVAKASNDAQSNFLSTVSHEIRTPINAIMGMDEIILRESTDKSIVRYAAEIKDSSRTLLSLVNDLLDSSRLDADKLKIIPVEYDLASMISDMTNMIRSRAKQKNLKFYINVDENIPHTLFGDEIRVKQCALNLLTNAVKYTETGSITLNVEHEVVNRGSIRLRFQVIDTGIGMKDEDIKRIYDRFARFNEKKNRNIEGTGLGMNIVKRLLELMGSELEIKSIYEKGSDFSFVVHQGVISWDPIGDYNAMYEKSLESYNSYRERFSAPGARILVVDDMKVNLTVFKGLLKKTRIKIDTALSGKAALELIRTNDYDVIFLDHRMPKMDGIETLINMRELPSNPNERTPCIALTANAIAGARELYINAGFSDYLSKPIDSQTLEKLLIEYLPGELVELHDYDAEYSLDDEITDKGDASSDTSFDDEHTADDTSFDETDDKLHEVLTHLEGIDYAVAIENCLDDETLTEAMQDFIQSLETKPDEIDDYRQSKDYRNYTIQVHALKSTARLIGAIKLSEDAAYLEKCGDEENASEIDARTDDLLELYESYGQKLIPFIEATTSDDVSDLETISDEMYNEALCTVRELIDSFDFSNAEQMLKMLKNYKFSETQQKNYDIIWKMVRDVDRDSTLAYLDKILI